MEDSQQEAKKTTNPFIGVLVVLVVAVVGFAVWTSTKQADQKQSPTTAPSQAVVSESPSATAEDSPLRESNATAITVEGGNFFFKPNEIRVKKGEKVSITFTNAGGMHDFVIDELGVKTEVINDGETATVEFTPNQTGSFEFYCSVGNHRQMGMKGTLIVE